MIDEKDVKLKESGTQDSDLPHFIALENEEGKEAIIDFNGDSVKYSGDMPVEEGAKVFFDCAFSHYKKMRDEELTSKNKREKY